MRGFRAYRSRWFHGARSGEATRAKHSRPAERWLWMVLLLVLIELVYVFIASAGHWVGWPVYMNYYDLLAEGFRAGHLYLPVAPSPELLAKQNPYDPAHVQLWFWDSSLYQGRYYFYFGPVPALLQAAGKSLLRIRGLIGDQFLVFGFFSIGSACAALLVERMARRLFDHIPPTMVVLGILAVTFANPVPYLLASGGVYQAAISGGQAFLFAGLLFAFDAASSPDQRGKLQLRLVLAGLFWALALGCRVSLGPAIALLIVLTALSTGWVAGLGWRQTLLDGTRLCVPVAAAVAGLLLYNKLRFDEWFNFGVGNQLSTMKWRTSTKYVVPNLYSYLLRPYEASCQFPFALVHWNQGAQTLPAALPPPRGYLITEPVVGWMRVVPVAWMAVVAITYSFWRPRAWLRPTAWALRTRLYHFCLLSFVVVASVTGIVEISLYMATMRFLADVSYGLSLLGVLGCYALYAGVRTVPARRVAALVLVLLSAGTMSFGLLLGFQGYNGHFQTNNPDLTARFVKAFSVCPHAPKPEQKP